MGQDNFKRGTAELLVLFLLAQEDMYGYQIVNVLNERSGGRYKLLEGSLSLIMMKLEETGYVSGRTELVGKRRTRRYYAITEAGKVRLKNLLSEYKNTVLGIQMILNIGGEKSDE